MGDKFDGFKSFLFESFLEASADYGKELGKEALTDLSLGAVAEIGGQFMVEVGGNMIPAIGPAISSFRLNKKLKNMHLMMKELSERNNELSVKFQKQSEENKQILDDIFNMMVEKVSNTWQEEKIKYLVNGYSELLEVENPSFDTAYLYFDTLDKLTILDIETLKLSYRVKTMFYDIDGNPATYRDVTEKFDIDNSQYNAVRQNLLRIGLLENDYDDKLEQDLKNIIAGVDELRDVANSILSVLSGKRNAKLKKLTSKSELKLKAKDKLKISKFGIEFIRFFMPKEDVE
ncbi:hypothetical protein [Enterococcus sp. LJL90]